VYLHLLKMYLFPPDPKSLGLAASLSISREPQHTAALILLETHANQINTSKAMELLPHTTKVSDILTFLENVLEDTAARKRSSQVLRSLLYSEHLQVQEQRMFYQKTKCIITEEKVCHKCKRRIGNSAFVRYPDGTILHYFCHKEDSKVYPVD